MSEDTATDGAVLGEAARLALVAAFQPHVDVPGWWVDQVEPVVAALVARAHAAGAAEERERWAAAMEAASIALVREPEPYISTIGLRDLAERIARGPS